MLRILQALSMASMITRTMRFISGFGQHMEISFANQYGKRYNACDTRQKLVYPRLDFSSDHHALSDHIIGSLRHIGLYCTRLTMRPTPMAALTRLLGRLITSRQLSLTASHFPANKRCSLILEDVSSVWPPPSPGPKKKNRPRRHHHLVCFEGGFGGGCSCGVS